MRFGRTVFGCLLIAVAAYEVMAGCASIPAEDVRVVRLDVDNGLIDEAAVYVNGFFVGRVDGMKSRPILIPESQLVRGGCAVVRIKTMWLSGYSDERCITRGGHFDVKVTPSHIWLNPWR